MPRLKNSQSANQGKQIKAVSVSEPNPEQLPPIFCLRHMRKGFAVTDCELEEKAAFADTLFNLTQLTWSQIKQAPKHGLGSEKLDRTSIKGDGIPDIVSEDTTLLALRFAGKKAMVGFRDGIVFHVIWLDREFKLYDHG